MDTKYYFTSESVTEGHPDKICDQVADSILDELLRQDPMSRCACITCSLHEQSWICQAWGRSLLR